MNTYKKWLHEKAFLHSSYKETLKKSLFHFDRLSASGLYEKWRKSKQFVRVDPNMRVSSPNNLINIQKGLPKWTHPHTAPDNEPPQD